MENWLQLLRKLNFSNGFNFGPIRTPTSHEKYQLSGMFLELILRKHFFEEWKRCSHLNISPFEKPLSLAKTLCAMFVVFERKSFSRLSLAVKFVYFETFAELTRHHQTQCLRFL